MTLAGSPMTEKAMGSFGGRAKKRRVFSGLMFIALALPIGALAQADVESENGNWSFRVGLGVFAAPEYSGSDELEYLPFPSIDVTYKDFFFASVIDGVGFNVIRQESWGAAFSGQIVMGRENEGDIKPLDPIDDRFLPQLEIFTDSGPTRLHGSVIGDGKRFSGEVGLQYLRQASDRSVYMIGGGARWNNAAWNDERFSITASEATRIGVEPYFAGASVSEGYIQGAYVYYLSPVYALEVVVEIAELIGDSGDSPLADELGSTTQPSMFFRINRQL